MKPRTRDLVAGRGLYTELEGRLTPLAAAGLVVIMIGANSETVAHMSVPAAILPFVAGGLALFVAIERFRLEREERDSRAGGY